MSSPKEIDWILKKQAEMDAPGDALRSVEVQSQYERTMRKVLEEEERKREKKT